MKQNEIKIDIGITSIRRIYHLADIHVRNLKRHHEYKIVFERTVEAIKATLQPNDIIFLGGDIVHAKTDMTPELIQSVQEFFKMFADLAPTILITGNHDCNLNNASRLDALTPIVNALNHPNLHYLKESGVYHIADKHFVVMSVFDKPKDFIKANSFEGDFKIALHHGAVNNAITDIGFILQNDHVNIDTFEGYKLTLLGDIHKPAQYLNQEKTIAYCGSLLQQNFGEGLIHGMLVWDTNTCTSEFIEIPNDICYYTLEINHSNYNPIPLHLQDKTIRLRIKVQNTEPAILKQIIAEIKTQFNIEEYVIQKINNTTQPKTRTRKINIGDVRDVEYQNELISKYLENKFTLSDEMLDGVRHINRTVNSGLTATEKTRNITWIPKRFEFANMFSYGLDNVVDFTNMKGVYGIFAPNASGKSTLLDALTYCIFDKCSRTSKASSVLNNKSDSFNCIFNFELDNINYYIERTGTKGRGEHVRINVDFYAINEFGQKESLNGKERSETNDNIRNILGTYEDFVLTSLSVQNNNSGFIEMAQKDRKDLLAQFLDINIFEELHNVANEDIKEVATLVKEYQRQDFSTQLANAITDIQLYSQEHKSYQIDKGELETKIKDLNEKILSLTSDLVPIDSSIENINVDDLNKINSKAEKVADELKQDVIDKTKELTNIDNRILELKTELIKFNISEIQDRINDLNSIKNNEKTLVGDVERLKAEVRNKLEKMEKLNDLEYDENCKFCMDNVFVKDAINTKASIEYDKKQAQNLIDQLNVVKDQITVLTPSIQEKEEYNNLQQEIHQKESIKASIESSLHQIDSKQHQLVTKLNEVKHQIEEYFKKETAITKNKTIKVIIDTHNNTVDLLKTDLNILNDSILQCHSNLILVEKLKDNADASIIKLKDLTQQYKFYEYYLAAVNRDGVPYDLITTAVPYIEQEINNILNQLVAFNLMLTMDGKNINCYIIYDQDNYWPIELTSGMEKFISSLAIRTALINVSSLPRPNFLAIDEGLGNLDAEVLLEFSTLLSYLEMQFTFIILISHIEMSRDMTQSLIEISKKNGFSKVHFE